MRSFPIAWAVCLLATLPAAADDLLLFKSGRTIEVRYWRFEGDWLHLELPRGATMVVPRGVLFEAKSLDLDKHRYLSAWRADRDFMPPDVLRAEVRRWDAPGPDVAGPDVAGSDIAGSDVAGSDVAGSRFAGRDVAGPDRAPPDASLMGVLRPDARRPRPQVVRLNERAGAEGVEGADAHPEPAVLDEPEAAAPGDF